MGINQNLAQILAAQYGKDVRQAIHDGIEECYTAANFNPRGVYNPDAVPPYSMSEIVYYNGSSYRYVHPTPSNTPTSSASHWQQIADRGLKGDPFEYEDFTPEQLAGLVGNGIKSILRTSGDGTPGTTDTYTITFDDDSITTFPVTHGSNTPAANIPITDAGGYFGTDNVEAALQQIGGYIKPFASYTYNGNMEYVISAVDDAADALTCVAHGLNNGDVVAPLLNQNAGNVYPFTVFPGGLTTQPYFVVEKTDNTFKLSLTSGGAAVDITPNASIDLTKFHFEKRAIAFLELAFSVRSKYRAIVQGRAVGNAGYYFTPSFWAVMSWVKSSGTDASYGYPNLSGVNGSIAFYIETDVRAGYPAVLKNRYVYAYGSAAAALVAVREVNQMFLSIANNITTSPVGSHKFSINGANAFIANGTKLEVYDI